MPDTAVIMANESLRTIEVQTTDGASTIKSISRWAVEDGFLNVYRDGRVVATFSNWKYVLEATDA